jgi:hypothetical protein
MDCGMYLRAGSDISSGMYGGSRMYTDVVMYRSWFELDASEVLNGAKTGSIRRQGNIPFTVDA